MARSDIATVGPQTVTVLGSHWPSGPLWSGFDWSRAIVLEGSIWSNDDYHLAVPWAHFLDRKAFGYDPDIFGIYRLRLKRGWRSFVRAEDGTWLVSRAKE